SKLESELRARPMSLQHGPLGAAVLARTADETWVLILAMHHLLADGWSTSLLTGELQDLLAGKSLSPTADMTGYLGWLHELEAEHESLESAWRNEVAGFAQPTLLATLAAPQGGDKRAVKATAVLDAATTTALEAQLRTGGHTLADAAQGAWATVLAALTGRNDVSLGATRSGRDAEVGDIANTVGMFITTAPVRLQPRPGAPFTELLDSARRQGTVLARAAHLGMGRIKQVLGNEPFDTLLVVENHPPSLAVPTIEAPRITALGGSDATNYPVCFTLYPGAELRLEVELAGQQEPGTCRTLVEAAARALAEIVHGIQPDPRLLELGTLPGLTTPTPPRTPPAQRQETRVGPGAAPAAAAAALIAAAIGQVLGTSPVDANADIFALGADSMSAMALVGAVRSRGLAVKLSDIYAHPTARGLAERAVRGGNSSDSAVEDHGELEPTPALRWYSQMLRDAIPGAGRGFQQLRVLEVPESLEATALQGSLEQLVARHPALRLGLDGEAPRISERGAVELVVLDPDAGSEAFSTALGVLCRGLDERQGKVFGALFRPGNGAPGTLALAIHHVAVDIYSWSVIVDELKELASGGRPGAPTGTNLRTWAAAQHRAAASLQSNSSLVERWVAVLEPGLELADGRQRGLIGDSVEEVRVLPVSTTGKLLDLGALYGMDTVLNAGLIGLLPRLNPGPGNSGGLVIEAEGHGRPTGEALDDAREHLEVSNTVGWFTATWPVRLAQVPGSSGPAAWITAARAAKAALPSDTVSYGLLRHLAPEAGPVLAAAEAAASPQLLLNYLGRENRRSGPWQQAADAAQLESDLGIHRDLPASHPVELNAHVAQGEHGAQLVLRWQFASVNSAARALPGHMTDALEALASSPGASSPAAGVRNGLHNTVALDAGEIGRLLGRLPDAEVIWPLTGVQRAMAVHARSSVSDTYHSLAGLEMRGPFDPAVLQRAVRALFESHPQLRTTVHWPHGSDPVLVGRRGLHPSVVVREAHGLELPAREELVRRVHAEHMRKPFDLGNGPMLRLELIDFGLHPVEEEEHHHLVLANHHLLLDGWSIPPLVTELLEAYAADARRPAAPAEVAPAHSPYDGFALSLLAQKNGTALRGWKRALAGAGEGHVLRNRDASNTTQPVVIAHQVGEHVHD
ncbi:MAG: condensation domain-containing protein, partial [Micrococcaceae bacterium]|nr:condensation domain-containing protein [Micrococcaceae bacterium]